MSSPRWLAVISNPRSESEAESRLRAKGYDAYCPRLIRWATHARRREKKSYPLFPRYLFCRLGPQGSVYEIRATEGINGLVRNADGPLSIDPEIIEQLMTAETLGHFDQTEDPKPQFAPGQPVRVMSGPFLGFAAKVIKAPPHKRVEILLTVLGAERAVKLDPAHLEKM